VKTIDIGQNSKEMTSEQSLGKKRAKQIATLEAKALNTKNRLVESNNNIATTINS
jgi:hypothetical protein